MRKLEGLLWDCFFLIAMFAMATEVGSYLGRPRRQTNEASIDAEREFMRPEWLNDNFQSYYDDVEIFINDEHVVDAGACYINRLGEVYINWDLDERWKALLLGKNCTAHEVGHWVDRQNGYPSETEEFREAIDLAARMDWQIAHFPCITGKPCEDEKWGGYGEIYADLFERESIGDIPAILWDWYLPYYLGVDG